MFFILFNVLEKNCFLIDRCCTTTVAKAAAKSYKSSDIKEDVILKK